MGIQIPNAKEQFLRERTDPGIPDESGRRMCACVVLGIVFAILSQEIGLGNDSEMTYF